MTARRTGRTPPPAVIDLGACAVGASSSGSKGKFYADGWSTTALRFNYALVAGVMLAVIVAVYLALGPMGISLN